ncbi:MAG TPA: hypothetical protein VI759_05765 [Dehalococcoidia bacterium]|nr:hypothetical protein [Dehalococcoidia bacterium]
MKRGLFLGIIVGAAIAFLIGKQKTAAPSLESTPNQAPGEAAGVVDKLRGQVKEAIEAGREAADEKEAEMRRRFEESKS